ncbi:MFS transporter [Tessaracoccus lacteus]|uniref:MFS transporter n=1 Tax=Tessaracoccus lacteus TaxID=3041766 RepID=A0ABY8PVD0_9ACTN|nr:MFS transporter [Tessaracoccus sp. T21]WGT46331.1 MFS transporter [Tessaracoccus sp. T21]
MFRQILWPVLIPSLLFAVSMGALTPVLVLAALGVGASESFAAILVGLMGAVSLCLAVPAGIMIDRLGDTRAMYAATIASVFLFGAIVVALAWHSAASLALYTAGLMLLAPISDVWNLARQAVVAETVAPADLGRAMTSLGGCMRVGTLVGPIASAGLLYLFPMWSVFVFSACCGIAAIVVLSLPVARTLEERTPRPRPAADGHRPRLEVAWTPVVLAGVSISTLAVARAIQPVSVQLWGVQIGLHESAISLLIALGAALELILMFPGGYLKDRLGRSAVLLACLGAFAVGFTVMVLAPSLTGLIAAIVVMAVGNGLGAGVNMTIGADLSPAVGRARFLGIWALFTNTGKLGGPSLFSLAILLSSLSAGILTSAALAAFGAVWILAWSRRIGLPKGLRRG